MAGVDEPTQTVSQSQSLQRRDVPSSWFYGLLFLAIAATAGTVSWLANDGASTRVTSGATLEGADLSGAKLVAARLPESVLTGAVLDDVTLTSADLRNSDFRAVRGARLVLERACLRDTSWAGATVTAARLDGADIRGADFSQVAVFETRSAVGAIYDSQTRFPPSGPFDGATDVEGDHVPDSPCR